ncbi:MAG TPA: hypothetical protein VIK11_07555 [Tepidiformaceae bacterium]
MTNRAKLRACTLAALGLLFAAAAFTSTVPGTAAQSDGATARARIAQLASDGPGPLNRIPRPNPTLTPGAVLTTDVPTICSVGYTATVRDVSEATKDYVYNLYGIVARVPGSYEIDHLISLELGGSNDVANLWPEPYDEANGAHLKDILENKMHDLVCAGVLDVSVAQQAIATDWYAAYLAYGSVPTPPSTPTPRATATLPPASTPTPIPSGLRTGAICNDGTSTTVTGSGACSGHGGVANWLY